ncbi:hypothetical protein GDR74_10175 [Microvirga thermotolerans]|uniref:Helix-turn-helix domain-containing protein n=1 Tax=Microvirga thermotolerans TaxID=2651334 RepID=A0A5P9K611_9HYPH|nr:hypothetical protein GDR74_10175 [Microvirga thermotolerans]
MWSEEAVAHFLGKSTDTLKRWRREGGGPAFVRIGRTPQYRVQDMMVWMLRNRIEHHDLSAPIID